MSEVQKDETRPAAVAERYYPGNPDTLNQEIDRLFDQAPTHELPGNIKALVCPHAGYMYSGKVAASAYKNLGNRDYRVVAIISPSHLDSFEGVSVFTGKGYETPLGLVPVATEYAETLIAQSGKIFSSWDGHRKEHALEVQLPFLQKALTEIAIIPIVMGDQFFGTSKLLGEALAETLKDVPALIVASSDLSHYHSYAAAAKIDGHTLELLERYDATGLMQSVAAGSCEACGVGPIIAAMIAAKMAGANKLKVLDYKTSGDVTGDHSAVTGYVSAAIYE